MNFGTEKLGVSGQSSTAALKKACPADVHSCRMWHDSGVKAPDLTEFFTAWYAENMQETHLSDLGVGATNPNLTRGSSLVSLTKNFMKASTCGQLK